MHPAPAAQQPPDSAEPEPLLDAEKLDVYAVALELQALASTLVPPQNRVLHDQMERASLSVVLNIAEGAGRRSRKDKRRFYTMARGSACECAAAVDVLRQRHLAPEGACATARVPRRAGRPDAHQAGPRASLSALRPNAARGRRRRRSRASCALSWLPSWASLVGPPGSPGFFFGHGAG